jgi:hypothetical protein
LHKYSIVDKLVFVLRKNIAELKDINARAVKGQIKNSKEFGKDTHDNYRQYGQTLLNNQREWFNSIDRYAQEIGKVDRDKRIKIANAIKNKIYNIPYEEAFHPDWLPYSYREGGADSNQAEHNIYKKIYNALDYLKKQP